MANTSKSASKRRTSKNLDIRPLQLARNTGSALQAADRRLITAESCTGGMIAEWLTRVPGSSDWFEGALVSYSNELKQSLLGVSATTLRQHGAVSEETACEMALGALNHGADLAVAVTGIAGPDGGSRYKPVGTVCLAWAERDGQVHSAQIHLDGDRQSIRRQTAALALIGIQDRLTAGSA